MKRVIIVHRWGGSSQDDWRSKLKEKLERLGYKVLAPDMPRTEIPIIEKWIKKLAEVVDAPDSETYFIGHSIGCQTILRYLETIDEKVGGALFVAGWFKLENLEDEETEKIAEPWLKTPINIEKIKKILPKSILLISKDDPYEAFQENIDKFSQFVSSLCVFDYAGHFTKLEDSDAIFAQFKNLISD